MPAVFEGFMPSRRRPARSQSESGKQLHARWGDAAISAPNGGGWSQHYLEDEVESVVYQAHGSPDSQKTLVNDSPNLSLKDGMEKVSIEEIRQPTPPVVQKERGAITITIPLPWGRKSHRRSLSASRQQALVASSFDRAVTAESRPALPNLTTSIDEVIDVESRPATAESCRATSPIVHTQSPVYDDISTFFTRAVFPEKHGPRGLPQIQTAVPINKSQPASALSILSPVAEKYNGLSESNNATPMDNTPIAQHIAGVLPLVEDGTMDVSSLADRLENYARQTPPSLPASRGASPGATPVDRPDSRSTARFPSRPASRGPGIGEVAYMRASSKDPPEQIEGPRSASREPVRRRTPSLEPIRRRALSRDTARRRADSPRGMGGRSYSREGGSRGTSREPGSRHHRSRDPTPVPAPLMEVAEPSIGRELSLEPVRPRAESPGPASRRVQSREPAPRRELSPVAFTRRAMSRDAITHRRISADLSRRAISVDPVHHRTSPRDDVASRHDTPPMDLKLKESEPETSLEDLTSDETTDIENETDEMYFESRKGWNGPAVVGANSKGFYKAVIDDYKMIAKGVEADQTGTGAKPPALEIVNMIMRDKPESETLAIAGTYGGPDVVPCYEELWG